MDQQGRCLQLGDNSHDLLQHGLPLRRHLGGTYHRSEHGRPTIHRTTLPIRCELGKLDREHSARLRNSNVIRAYCRFYNDTSYKLH